MPTSLVGLVLFVVLLAPGMVYVRRRERQQAATPVSALRETTTIVLASVTCELLVAGLLAVARVVWPAGTPTSVRWCVTRPVRCAPGMRR